MSTSTEHSPLSPNDVHPAKRARMASPDRGTPAPASASATDQRSPSAASFVGAGGGGGVGLSSPPTGPPSEPTPTAGSTADGPGGDRSSSGADKASSAAAAAAAAAASSFRNVSACNRCRLRKNRCDQKLPSCSSCERASVACVGYDPITKRQIPRSYVYYLERRVEQLESLLQQNNIAFPPADNLEYCSRPGPLNTSDLTRSPTETHASLLSEANEHKNGTSLSRVNGDDLSRGAGGQRTKLGTSPNQAGSGASVPRYLGQTNGVSFARVVFAAVQSSVSDQRSQSEKAGVRPYKPVAGNGNGGGSGAGGTSMRDSFFGLHTKPTIHPATFPDKELGLKLVTLYFEHANPQIPVLHRGDFMNMFELAYAPAESGRRVRGPKELYMLNMVFAIGGGIIMGDSMKDSNRSGIARELNAEANKHKQCQPEEYHASAIVHLEACLSNSGGGLEELQAVLLLANFALLRPVPPGLWYIIGVAVRLAVDLGLHYEDGKDLESGLADTLADAGDGPRTDQHLKERGRREYIRDLRRRLWWCTYSFDRLVSTCVGRPFGISDQVITTEFPSLLEDRYITPAGIIQPKNSDIVEPSYKLVAYHYFRLRLLQSEILQVLQYQQAQIARAGGVNLRNPYMHTQLPSPFLARFGSFRSWRIDIDRRLYEWKVSAPTKRETGVAFSTEFLELNYWQAIIMLYRQSLSVPAMFESEYNTSREVNSPTIHNVELREDEERVCLKVAEAGQRILRLYRQLHLIGLVNYTYLATHHLFMAGISYLYAIWHSPIVRSRLSMDEVDFTVLAATSVFTDLMEKCPPAEACRDAFERTAKATIKMANSTGGFGQAPNNVSGLRRKRSTSLERQRMDWSSTSGGGSSRNDGASRGHGHSQQPSLNRTTTNSATTPSSYDMLSDVFPSPSTASASLPPYRSSGGTGGIKTDPDTFSSILRSATAPTAAVNNQGLASSSNTGRGGSAVSEGPLPLSPEAVAAAAAASGQILDSSSLLAASPSQTGDTLTPRGEQNLTPQMYSAQPVATTSAGVAQQQEAGLMPFAELQGMDFLQSLQQPGRMMDGSGGGATGAGLDQLAGTGEQLDLGLGLGWEGFHHDFSDGQQVDLFDGFFFGGQQGGGGGMQGL